MFYHTLHKLTDLKRSLSEVETLVDEISLNPCKANCKSKNETALSDKEIYEQKVANAKFTYNRRFSCIKLDWLRSRAHLNTRAFVCELMRLLFDVSEIKNRSAKGGLPPASKMTKDNYKMKAAIDPVRRDFIYGSTI